MFRSNIWGLCIDRSCRVGQPDCLSDWVTVFWALLHASASTCRKGKARVVLIERWGGRLWARSICVRCTSTDK